MLPSVVASSRFPRLEDFSAADRQIAEKALADRHARAQQAAQAQAAKLQRARESAARALRGALGAAGRRTLGDFMQAERLTAARGASGEQAALAKARSRRGDALLRRLGVEKKTMAAVAAKFQAALADIAPEPKAVPGLRTRDHLKVWRDLSPWHRVGLPWGTVLDMLGDVEPDEGDPHRWFVYQPPFFGFNFRFVPVHSSNFVVDRLLHLDPAAALVGHTVTMDIDVVDDHDYASGEADTQIAFGFVPPATGLLEVLIDAQCVECRHELRTKDRWGWSNSTTSQVNYLSLDVLHPNTPHISLAEMSRFVKKTADDTHSVVNNLALGEHYFAQLRSSGPLPVGRHVVICVGTRSFDKSGANDVEIHSKSAFRWFIRSVEVRVLP